MEFLRIAHVSSTIDAWCFIGSVVTFAFNKRNLLTRKNVDPFLIGIFVWKLMEFLRIAHVSSTIDSWCFIGSVVTFAFNKRTYCTTKKRWQNQNRFQKCRSYYERPFLHGHFSMKIAGILKNCSCFIDFRLLMLYRIRRNFCI